MASFYGWGSTVSKLQSVCDIFIFRSSWYSTDRLQKDERPSWPWSHSVVLNARPLDWEYSTLTTSPLLHNSLFTIWPNHNHDQMCWTLEFSFQIYSKARIYFNELVLTLFNPFDINYKKLKQKTSGNKFLGYLGEWGFHIFPWIILQYSVQTICHILDGALCDEKMKIAGNSCWLLLQRALS